MVIRRDIEAGLLKAETMEIGGRLCSCDRRLAESSTVTFSSSSGSSMMNAKKSYFFNKPSDEVTLAVTYAQGVKTLTLPL